MIDFLQSACGKRFINFLARVPRQIRQLAIRHPIIHSPNFFIDRVRPEIHEADPVIVQLRRRYQGIVWRNRLRGILHIEIGTEDDLVAVTTERRMKFRITILRLVEDHVEHHQARACSEQSIKQKLPNFS